MAAGAKNEDAKRTITEGMAEAGTQPTLPAGSGKPGGTGATGEPPKQGGADEMTEGMSRSGQRLTDPAEDQAEGHPS